MAAVAHTNGVTDSIAVKAGDNWMRRPSRLSTTGVAFAQNFDSGELSYDGAGNIRAMGADVFLYDRLSRLKDSTVRLPSWVGGTARSQGYAFDDYGGITSVTGTNARSTPTSSSTNRLSGTGVSYDVAGNLTCWGGTFLCNGTSYQFDRLNRLQRMTTAAGPAQEDWAYVYTADDERFWSLKLNGSGSLWSLRDLSGSPVRQFEAHVSWSTTKDSILRDGQLVASVHQADGTRHYHLDHLGTPRLTTTPAAQMIAHHIYFPFGEEVTGSTTDGERLRFTGHERDLNNMGGAGDDLDYMHARFHSPVTGRFLSVDVVDGDSSAPKSWNRYAYVVGNPINYIDPDGEAPTKALVYLVKGVSGAYRVARRPAAVRAAAKHPHAVTVKGAGASGAAKRLAAEANPGARIVRDNPHRPGQLPHYQPKGGGKGHVHYIRDLASGLTVAHYLANQGAIAEFVGELVDFFNPLSIGHDIFQIYDSFSISGEEGYLEEEYVVRADSGPPAGTSSEVFFYRLDAAGFTTGPFISTYDLFNSGRLCIEGVCR